MNAKYMLLATVLIAGVTSAQTPEDALRYSFYPQSSTGRISAIGGAMGSVGGDITATFVNPAGLGFFHNSDAAITPGFMLQQNRFNYRDTKSTNNNNAFAFGPTGVILGGRYNAYTKKNKFAALSLAITQAANFNSHSAFNGLNNYSSYAEQLAEEFASSGKSIDAVLNTLSPLPYTAAPALWNYLIDTQRIGNGYKVRAVTENLLDAGFALRQEYDRTTKGGLYEAAIGIGGDLGNRWMVGGSVGIPLVYYNSITTITERDTAAVSKYGFTHYTFTDEMTTKGIGGNLKLGVIFRPEEYFRIGLAIHSPSLIRQEETRSTSLSVPAYNGVSDTLTRSGSFTEGNDLKNTYSQLTPWKAILSASYVFREVENVNRQRGFITADIEYVNHKGSRFYTDEASAFDNSGYFKSLNKVIKNEYRGTFNAKIGGEIKFNPIMARLGFAYYGNPYKKEYGIKADKMQFTGGLGYRNKGMYFDIAYVYTKNRDAQFPYRLSDRANTFAVNDGRYGNVVATVGFKL